MPGRVDLTKPSHWRKDEWTVQNRLMDRYGKQWLSFLLIKRGHIMDPKTFACRGYYYIKLTFFELEKSCIHDWITLEVSVVKYSLLNKRMLFKRQNISRFCQLLFKEVFIDGCFIYSRARLMQHQFCYKLEVLLLTDSEIAIYRGGGGIFLESHIIIKVL